MKKVITLITIFLSLTIEIHGQKRDTLLLFGYEVILPTEGFKGPLLSKDDLGLVHGWQYYYVRKYEQPQRTSASFILVFAGHYPLSYYMPEEMEHEVYSQSMNRYGGRTEKCRSSDSLYFRQDTYKEYFDERLSVQYYYVREEDVAMFDRIMEEIQITPLPDHVLSPHCTDAGQGEQIE